MSTVLPLASVHLTCRYFLKLTLYPSTLPRIKSTGRHNSSTVCAPTAPTFTSSGLLEGGSGTEYKVTKGLIGPTP